MKLQSCFRLLSHSRGSARVMSLVVGMFMFTAAFVQEQDEAPPITEVDLIRTYEVGESQDYTASIKISMEGAGFEGNLEAAFTRRVVRALDGGGARVELSYGSVKMTFGGQEVPVPDTDKVEEEYDKHGLPKTIDTESEDPFTMLAPVHFLPAKVVGIGDAFDIKWRSSNGDVVLDGEGRLIATGMLYEEHVAKISMKMDANTKGEESGTFEVTTYTNSKTGKLVKAEGKFRSSEGDFVGEFVIAKVRS